MSTMPAAQTSSKITQKSSKMAFGPKIFLARGAPKKLGHMTRASPDPPSRHHHPCMVPSGSPRPGLWSALRDLCAARPRLCRVSRPCGHASPESVFRTFDHIPTSAGADRRGRHMELQRQLRRPQRAAVAMPRPSKAYGRRCGTNACDMKPLAWRSTRSGFRH